jgi:hypothetical protein
LVWLLLVSVGKNIGTLERLGEEAEDVKDDEDGLFGV